MRRLVEEFELIKILLVEDSDIDREIFLGLLRKIPQLKSDVKVAKTYSEALTMVEENDFSIIVSDLDLPDCQRSEASEKLPVLFKKFPGIILSGHDDEKLLQLEGNMGVFDYLVKDDLSPGILRRSIHGALSRFQTMKEKEELQNRLLRSQRLEAVGKLTGGIAHDFNNKLAVLLANLEIVQSLTPTEDVCQRYLSNMEKSIKQSSDLINKLLAFGRGQEVDKKTLHLQPLILDAMKLLKPALPSQVVIETDLTELPAYCEIDVSHFDQVFTNLFINASQAINEETGRITVSLEWVEFTPRNKSTAEPFVKFSISDNGCGMSSEVREKVLEPYFSTKTKSKQKGTGLGLSVVDGIIHKLGGELRIESQEGEGTTMNVFLPRKEKPANEQEATVIRPQNFSPDSLCVLYAEDEDEIRELFKDFLEGAGFEVLTAENGEVALQVFESHKEKINVVLSDFVMPKMNGMEFFLSVREKDPEMGFVFMSGYSQAEISKNSHFPPRCIFHSKPCSPKDVIMSLKKYLKIDSDSDSDDVPQAA